MINGAVYDNFTVTQYRLLATCDWKNCDHVLLVIGNIVITCYLLLEIVCDHYLRRHLNSLVGSMVINGINGKYIVLMAPQLVSSFPFPSSPLPRRCRIQLMLELVKFVSLWAAVARVLYL